MKKVLLILLMAISITFISCTDGDYIGKEGQEIWVDSYGLNGKPKKGIDYDISVGNAFMAFVFSETIIVPILYATDYIYVPVGLEEVN